jgi:hypothetical protein
MSHRGNRANGLRGLLPHWGQAMVAKYRKGSVSPYARAQNPTMGIHGNGAIIPNNTGTAARTNSTANTHQSQRDRRLKCARRRAHSAITVALKVARSTMEHLTRLMRPTSLPVWHLRAAPPIFIFTPPADRFGEDRCALRVVSSGS